MFPHSELVHICVGSVAFTSLASLCRLSPLALTMFHLPQDSLSPEGWDLMEESLIRSKFHSISLSSYSSFVWASVFVFFCFRRKIL